jgi:hypothetical protein
VEALVVDTGTAKWVTLRGWGDVHAGVESCARAGVGVTLEQLRHCFSVLITSAIETVTRDTIEKTWQEIEFHLDVSRATNCAHIEMY